MTHPSSDSNGPGLWLGLSIGATLLCCLPLGIPGIVYAALAMGAQSRGDYATAEFQTRQARGWTLAAAITGIIVVIIYVCTLRSQFN
jgi:hypothetical protein